MNILLLFIPFKITTCCNKQLVNDLLNTLTILLDFCADLLKASKGRVGRYGSNIIYITSRTNHSSLKQNKKY